MILIFSRRPLSSTDLHPVNNRINMKYFKNLLTYIVTLYGEYFPQLI